MGNNTFELEFRKECKKILNELYYNPLNMGEVKLKRIVIKAEKRYIDYLVELNLIKDLKTASSGEYGIQLERKGFEVFEKYCGWDDYLIKVVDRELRISNAKELAIQYWWIPIGLSIISLIISIISLFLKV